MKTGLIFTAIILVLTALRSDAQRQLKPVYDSMSHPLYRTALSLRSEMIPSVASVSSQLVTITKNTQLSPNLRPFNSTLAFPGTSVNGETIREYKVNSVVGNANIGLSTSYFYDDVGRMNDCGTDIKIGK